MCYSVAVTTFESLTLTPFCLEKTIVRKMVFFEVLAVFSVGIR